MEKYQTHVCLVSHQATPNITPALDPQFRPERVVMVVSTEMKETAQCLEAVLRISGVKTDRLEIADAFDIGGIQNTLLDWLAEHEGENIALNVTGGTKPMAMAAQEVFRSNQLPVFYVHPDKDRILPLYPKGESYDLGDRIKLRPYLNAHGYQIADFQRPDLPRKARELTEYLLGLITTHSKLIGSLNYYAHSAEETLTSSALDSSLAANGEFNNMIDYLQGNALLTLKKGRLKFSDEASRFFCNGGWLEFHTLGVVNDLRAALPIQDAAMSVKVVSQRGTMNEIDVAFLADNRLYLIECKTKKFANKDASQGSKEALYKLDSLTDLGGLNTRGMLISYQPLSERDIQRARDMKITTVVGEEILRLRERVIAWAARSS